MSSSYSSIETGLDVQIGGATTATGSTFKVAQDATVAVSIKEGDSQSPTGRFEVSDSQLVGADGGASLVQCDGVLHAAHVSVGRTCECHAHGVVGGITYPGPWTGPRCRAPPPTTMKCCSNSDCSTTDFCPSDGWGGGYYGHHAPAGPTSRDATPRVDAHILGIMCACAVNGLLSWCQVCMHDICKHHSRDDLC
eukprot:SAG11_NODE_1688_length_4445_cov_3.609296_2_plen_194_part_00